jgi:hypothetical protein
MKNNFTLQSDDWTWEFRDADDALYATARGKRLALPLPIDDVPFCVVPGVSIQRVEYLPDDSAQITWDNGASLTLQVVRDMLEWRFTAEQSVAAEFPGWTAIYNGTAENVRVYSERSFLDANGEPIFRQPEWVLPAACIGADGTTLTLLLDGTQRIGDVINGVRLEGDSLRGAFSLHEDGWRGAFDRLRRRVRPQADLSEYERADLAWYRSQWVQHFTFLYGREILNLRTHQLEFERFLTEAEQNFGGYDGILLWAGYPRMGVDERSQWDFFDDLPGGRAGLRRLADSAHARGVRIFVPYKPWDRSAALHGNPGNPPQDELARLIHDIDADGVFLDTMSAIDPAFRASIDALRPGVVFCSERRVKDEAFEIITGSWNQSATRDWHDGNWSGEPERMPGVDLARFIFPEHRLFVINRHSTGDDRLNVIMRGFFGGTGWVVWQDIFGLALPYSPQEAALLKKCRMIFRAHEHALNTDTPTPLLPTLIRGVYCNEFASREKRFWTFYNETDQAVTTPVLQIDPRPNTHLMDCWNGVELTIENGYLCPRLEPHSVGAVVELPRLLNYEKKTRAIQLNQVVEDAQIVVLQDAVSQTYAPNADEITLPAVFGRSTIQLMRGTEILDQMIVAGE